MDKIKDFADYLSDYGFAIALFLAGVFGALVSLPKHKHLSFWQSCLTIVSGGFIATYITPVLINVETVSINVQSGMAFILGYSGLKTIEWIISALKERIKQGK